MNTDQKKPTPPAPLWKRKGVLLAGGALLFGLVYLGVHFNILPLGDNSFEETELGKAIRLLESEQKGLNPIKGLSPTLQADMLSVYAAKDDTETLSRLLKFGAPTDQLNSSGTTALLSAIYSDSVSAAELLIKAKANVDLDVDGTTPKKLADAIGSPEIRALLVDGKKFNRADMLRRAAREGDEDKVKELLKAGVKGGDADASGYTALLDAVISNSEGVVNILLEAGASPRAQSKDGMTPAAAAAMSGNIKIMEALIDSGIDVNGALRGVNLLTIAIVSNHMDTVDVLLDNGAKATQENEDGSTPALIADNLGYKALAGRLGGVKMPASAKNIKLAKAIMSGDYSEFEKALRDSVDLNQTGPDGVPALLIAAAKGELKMVRALLSEGANVTATAPDGSNVIHAALSGDDKGTATKISLQALTYANDKSRKTLTRLLHEQYSSNRSAYVQLISSMGPGNTYFFDFLKKINVDLQINRKDPDGITPVIAAVLSQNTTAVEEFVSLGGELKGPSAKVSIQDLARSKKAWAVLAALPDDHNVPTGLTKGASIETKKEMQRKLINWGYYSGTIDGVFGVGSTAAMKRFVLDKAKELSLLSKHSLRISEKSMPAASKESYDLTARQIGCNWRVLKWKASKNTELDYLVGCIEGESIWNSSGFAYLHYGNGDDEIILLGPSGWDGINGSQDTNSYKVPLGCYQFTWTGRIGYPYYNQKDKVDFRREPSFTKSTKCRVSDLEYWVELNKGTIETSCAKGRTARCKKRQKELLKKQNYLENFKRFVNL